MYQLVETVVTKYLNVESIDVHSVVTEALVKHVDKLVVSCNDYFLTAVILCQMGLFYIVLLNICCHDLTFIMMKQESMPAVKSEVTIYFVFLGKSLNVVIFRLVWTCSQ